LIHGFAGHRVPKVHLLARRERATPSGAATSESFCRRRIVSSGHLALPAFEYSIRRTPVGRPGEKYGSHDAETDPEPDDELAGDPGEPDPLDSEPREQHGTKLAGTGHEHHCRNDCGVETHDLGRMVPGGQRPEDEPSSAPVLAPMIRKYALR
jgi:hypothetical protein